MQKITQFLEKNVEWIAVGAGVLFLFWMAYLYLLLPPVSKKGEAIKSSRPTMSNSGWRRVRRRILRI